MSALQKAVLLAMLDEVRDAIPFRGMRQQDLLPYRLLHQVREAIIAIDADEGDG